MKNSVAHIISSSFNKRECVIKLGTKKKKVIKLVSKKRGGEHDRLPATLTRSSPLQQQFL
jgi:hypothetical protein